MTAALLEVDRLAVDYPAPGGPVHAVRDVTLAVAPGEVLGIVGESGCGKSTLAYALLGDLGDGGARVRGRILWRGQDLLALPPGALRAVRGREIAMVHQDPGTALTPTLRIGRQLEEILTVHGGMDATAARHRVVDVLERVRLPDAARLARRYPHQLSGGQQQRVVIAMALLARPALLVLDEPTTGLDVTVEAAVLDLLQEIRRSFGVAVVLIAHNLGVIARVADRVGVMYAGELVELAPAAHLFAEPRHPYTAALLRCVPRPDRRRGPAGLVPIPGTVPSAQGTPEGCAFAPRCGFALPACTARRPDLDDLGPGWSVRCLRAGERLAPDAAPPAGPRDGPTVEPAGEILRVENLRVHFPARGRPGGAAVRAVDGVDLVVEQGRVTAIVGESGCGKSTLGNAIAGLVPVTGGRIRLDGTDIAGRPARRRGRAVHQALQMVFQDHAATLNPVLRVGRILARPLRLFRKASGRGVAVGVRRLLDAVGLDPALATRRPGRLSGGQRQRVAIARAFAGEPRLVVCDEITSALDVSVQASVLGFLRDLQRRHGTSLVFISHDLGVVRHLADRIVVMYLGEICEEGPTEAVFAGPNHPYTEALLSAAPIPDPKAQDRRIRLEGIVPSAAAKPTGCVFHTRCPRKLGALCATEAPPRRDVRGGHRVRCQLPLGGAAARRVAAPTTMTNGPTA